ncbi:MAG: DUF418 domain-containing protein [Actinomycetaceae bacterium]|nr:DUF418 domain-containing protein [Actinomycetaceae bacterium]
MGRNSDNGINNQNSTSFTGGVRYPAPDVARGFMLLLIALANVALWVSFFPEVAQKTEVDKWIQLLSTQFINGRAYPLFSMLFGFGLVVMANRMMDKHVAARTRALDEGGVVLDPQTRESWVAAFRTEGVLAARRLLTRRGWWMLLFGAVHSLFFVGDVIGNYAFIALIISVLVVKKKWRVLYVIAGIILVLGFLGAIAQEMSVNMSAANAGNAAFVQRGIFLGPQYPLVSFGYWVMTTLLSPLLSAMLPSVIIGARIADTDLLTHPERYKGLLWATVFGGLGLGALLGTPGGMIAAFDVRILGNIPLTASLHLVGGIFGALGWLALLTLLAGPARETIAGWRWVLSAVGRRSMTAYLSQTALFIVIFLSMGLAGVPSVSNALAAIIAATVWLVTVVMCVLMEKAGKKRGPFEVLLRNAVARSAKPVNYPPVPVAYTQPTP